jgi:hypothetical protein
MADFRKLFDRVVAEVKPPQPLHVGVQRAVYVTKNDADARAAAEEARWNMRVTLSLRNHYERVENSRAIPVPAPKEPDVDDLLDRFLVIGTPRPASARSSLRREVGITHFNCSWFGDLEQPASSAPWSSRPQVCPPRRPEAWKSCGSVGRGGGRLRHPLAGFAARRRHTGGGPLLARRPRPPACRRRARCPTRAADQRAILPGA